VSKTRREQQAKIEKISLIAFLKKEQGRFFANVCRRLKSNVKDFYQNTTFMHLYLVSDYSRKKIMKEFFKFNNS